jgi:hypothetical protein
LQARERASGRIKRALLAKRTEEAIPVMQDVLIEG